jgi:hypothetical protein
VKEPLLLAVSTIVALAVTAAYAAQQAPAPARGRGSAPPAALGGPVPKLPDGTGPGRRVDRRRSGAGHGSAGQVQARGNSAPAVGQEAAGLANPRGGSARVLYADGSAAPGRELPLAVRAVSDAQAGDAHLPAVGGQYPQLPADLHGGHASGESRSHVVRALGPDSGTAARR